MLAFGQRLVLARVFLQSWLYVLTVSNCPITIIFKGFENKVCHAAKQQDENMSHTTCTMRALPQ